MLSKIKITQKTHGTLTHFKKGNMDGKRWNDGGKHFYF